MPKKIVIIGAGPTGLGAAYRLQELGYRNWTIYEKNPYIGGLSASFKDDLGFTWDQGGHVIHSHYEYFDRLLDKLLGDDYLEHLRQAWIRIYQRWVPYPFQNNIRHLPDDEMFECLMGLIEAQKDQKMSRNFKEWILNSFGKGIARHFLLPYNFKTWVHPLESMDKNWIAERVSVIDPERILENIIARKDDVDWGPNNKFCFPLRGGTGGFFSQFTKYIKERLVLNKELVEVKTEKKTLRFKNGEKINYDILINTAPLDLLVKMTGATKAIAAASRKLKHNGVLVAGLGFKKSSPSSKCWIYFPEKHAPFYRATYFSNYSPRNVPGKGHYSLMCETAYSKHQRPDRKKILSQTIQGLINTGIIQAHECSAIISKYLIDIEYAYPIPTLGRDKALAVIQPYLEKQGIYSRGRFGAWKYEIANMDHCVMQGVELINRLLLGQKEKTFR
jgi:protoporphyrinogen oxidase